MIRVFSHQNGLRKSLLRAEGLNTSQPGPNVHSGPEVKEILILGEFMEQRDEDVGEKKQKHVNRQKRATCPDVPSAAASTGEPEPGPAWT